MWNSLCYSLSSWRCPYSAFHFCIEYSYIMLTCVILCTQQRCLIFRSLFSGLSVFWSFWFLVFLVSLLSFVLLLVDVGCYGLQLTVIVLCTDVCWLFWNAVCFCKTYNKSNQEFACVHSTSVTTQQRSLLFCSLTFSLYFAFWRSKSKENLTLILWLIGPLQEIIILLGIIIMISMKWLLIIFHVISCDLNAFWRVAGNLY